MATRTPTTRDEQDTAYNPFAQERDTARDLQSAEQSAYTGAGIDQAEQYANDPRNASDYGGLARDSEAATGGNGLYSGAGAAAGAGAATSRTQKIKIVAKNAWNVVKKRKGLVALLGALGLGGGLLGGFAGFFQLTTLVEQLVDTNDSTSTALERRFLKMFGYAVDDDPDPICSNSTKHIKCRMGRISKHALRKLEKKGIVPFFEDGSEGAPKGRGYPDKNPKGYKIDLGDGQGPRSVLAADIPGFFSDKQVRIKFAAKVMGPRGAVNLRVKAWLSKHTSKSFMAKFGLKRDGGIADGKNKPGAKIKDTLEKLRDRIPGAEALKEAKTVKENIRKKVEGKLNKAKKGGTVYMTAVAGCVGVKAPGMIASTAAAVQLGQTLVMVNDILLSAGSKQKVSLADKTAGYTAGDNEATGTLLNERINGKTALDSVLLLAALGVNTKKPPVSSKFAPGYSILSSPIVQGARAADKASEPACNAIMSPAAMYSAMALDIAVTAAASATIVGGVVKIVASFAIAEVVSEVVKWAIADQGTELVAQLAQNEAIPNARGQELGDVLGIGAAGFFAAGAMARGLPALSESQLVAWDQVRRENDDFRRQMAVASLSPFDTSSKYTFMGSIIHSIRLGALQSGLSQSPLLATLSSLVQAPASLLTPNTQAANGSFSTNYCGYAKDFGLNTDDIASPAVNMAGLPCTGITPSQAAMSTEEALNIVSKWLDESKPINDGDTFFDLRKSKYIKDDTPLAEFIDSCTDASTGDYLYESAGCMAPQRQSDRQNAGACVSDGANQVCNRGDDGTAIQAVGQREQEAIAVFLLDYQALQAMNGEDEPDDTGNAAAAPAATAGAEIDLDQLYNDSTSIQCAPGTTDAGLETGYKDGNPIPIRLCELPNTSDVERGGGPGLANSRVSGAAYAMFEKMKQDLGLDIVPLNDSFRTMAQQEQAVAIYGGQAATPGYSNHQMGIAFDMGGGGCGYSLGITSCPSSAIWSWLSSNAGQYKFTQLESEWWHWQP